jgi:hypothetical protein
MERQFYSCRTIRLIPDSTETKSPNPFRPRPSIGHKNNISAGLAGRVRFLAHVIKQLPGRAEILARLGAFSYGGETNADFMNLQRVARLFNWQPDSTLALVELSLSSCDTSPNMR